MGFAVHRLVGMATVAGFVVAGHAAGASTLQDLAAAATKKGPVIWYESSPPEAIIKIAAAFNKRYPDIKIQYVRNTGGGGHTVTTLFLVVAAIAVHSGARITGTSTTLR